MNARQYSLHTGNPRRGSTPISRSPHTLFLQQYQEIGERVFAPEVFEQTAYFQNARDTMRCAGRYFHFTQSTQIEGLARNFVAKLEGRPLSNPVQNQHFSKPGHAPIVYPIKFSGCYELHDGNHRAAIACVNGQDTLEVQVVDEPRTTPLQQLLLDISWNLNRRDLYQPIESPELGDQWRLVRSCTDRLEMMLGFLQKRDGLPPHLRTYRDIACNHGWFVKQMAERGFEASGLDLDWAAREIGIAFYGLSEDQLVRGECVDYLQNTDDRFDVVSCLSLLHHFLMGRGAVSAEQMLHWLDRITGDVLFFEAGDGNEQWFRNSLKGWDPDTIQAWLEKETTFAQVIPLGTDRDRRPPFDTNYHRTLFACVR